MARRQVDNLAFSCLPDENVFHKARGMRVRITKEGTPRWQNITGDLFLSPTRLVIVEQLKPLQENESIFVVPLGYIDHERVVLVNADEVCIEFTVAADYTAESITDFWGADVVEGKYLLTIKTQTMVKVYYLLVHYLYQIRFGPQYELKEEDEDECRSSRSAFFKISNSRKTSDASSPRKAGGKVLRTEVKQMFVDITTTEVYQLDCSYEPDRKAFLDPDTNEIYLAEECIEPRIAQAARQKRSFSAQDVRRTLHDFKNLVSRLK